MHMAASCSCCSSGPDALCVHLIYGPQLNHLKFETVRVLVESRQPLPLASSFSSSLLSQLSSIAYSLSGI
jgi:hypothetical protein